MRILQFSGFIFLCLCTKGWSVSYTNPIIDSNNPDPAVLALPTGGYIAVATSNHATDPSTEDVFPIYTSEDLVNWQLEGYVFPAGSWPTWAAKNLWAPEIHFVNGRYLVYFSASAPNSRHSTGVAIGQSDSPLGPFLDLGQPLVYHPEDSVVGVIDATYFKDPQTGQDFLIWKTDTLVPFSISTVFIRELNEDGISFKNGSVTTQIMKSDLPSEQGIVEGMWMMYKEGTYFMFYSSSWFTLPTYHMGVARSTSILGPYTKREVPVVETDWERYNSGQNTTFEGPGHGSVVVDKIGDWWLVYHSWRYAHLDREPGRVMVLDKLEWHGAPQVDLWPVVEGGGVPSDTEREGPVV